MPEHDAAHYVQYLDFIEEWTQTIVPVERSRLFSENLLQAHTANILFGSSPECVLVDASGKFFAHFQFRWRTRF
jgi:hypothetical protein